jgi:predicted thioesterase
MTALAPGLSKERTYLVQERHLACMWGSGQAAVLATPALVAFCEECARLAVDPLLPEGQQTVGVWIGLRHLAATPPGMRVTVRAELLQVEGRRLRFRVEAHDEVERVGEGEHERFVVDVERFEGCVQEKGQSLTL